MVKKNYEKPNQNQHQNRNSYRSRNIALCGVLWRGASGCAADPPNVVIIATIRGHFRSAAAAAVVARVQRALGKLG